MLIKGIIKSAIVSLALTQSLPMMAVGAEPTQKTEDAIAVIKSDSRMQKAFAHILDEEEQNIEDLITLTEIPAPPFMEEVRAKYFAQMLRASGATDVTIDEIGNVIARIGGQKGKRTIAVAAHIDTVFPPETILKVRREGDKYIAPGIGDNTRGLVMLNTLMKAIHHAQIKMDANVLLIGSLGEEGLGDLRGVKHLFREGAPKIDSFIAIDGGGSTRVVASAVGSHRYRVTFKGPGGHSWGAFGLANPHHALGRAMTLLAQNGPSVTDHGDKSSFSVGRIGGGTSINSIPFASWMEVDMRSGNQSRLDMVDAVLQKSIQQALKDENAARKRGPELTVDIEKVGKRPAGKGDWNSSLVTNMVAIQKGFGYTARLVASSTDSNIPISKGIPAITISRGGRGGKAHSLEEWWINDKGYEAIQMGLLLIVAEAGLSK